MVSDEELVTASEFALAQVDEHFSGRPAEGDIAAFFHKLGATRAAQGLPLPELISAILLLKREIWMTARTHGVWESAMDLQKAVDLNRELGRFFDRAVYSRDRRLHRLSLPGEGRVLGTRARAAQQAQTEKNAAGRASHPAAFSFAAMRRSASSRWSAPRPLPLPPASSEWPCFSAICPAW